jgi:hypothetical protein
MGNPIGLGRERMKGRVSRRDKDCDPRGNKDVISPASCKKREGWCTPQVPISGHPHAPSTTTNGTRGLGCGSDLGSLVITSVLHRTDLPFLFQAFQRVLTWWLGKGATSFLSTLTTRVNSCLPYTFYLLYGQTDNS